MKPSEFFNSAVDPSGGAKARPVGIWAGGIILANLDQSLNPQLLIEFNPLGGSLTASEVTKVLETNGLSLVTQELLVNGIQRQCAILRSKQSSQVEQFIAIADHIVPKLGEDENIKGDLAEVEKCLKKWVEFFKPKMLETSREKILGLIGELLAIRDWIDWDLISYSAWRGPLGGLHDFVGTKDSLEVKVCGSRKGPLIHRVSDIDQIVPKRHGKLWVLSYRVSLGTNLSFSVHDLVTELAMHPIFQDPGAKEYFEDALKSAGYSSNLEAQFSRYELLEEALFEVATGFPTMQVERKNIDPRILDITYDLDFSALDEYRNSTTPFKLELN